MNAPLPLSVTLTMDETTAAELQQDESAVEVARAYVIDSDDMAALANTELKGVIARKKRLKELKDGFVAPAKQILENASNLFNPALEALTQAEAVLKSALTTWTTEQQRLADERQRQQREEERKARQKADQEAAAARAKAAEEAAAKQKAAQEAEEARQRAIAEGNAKEAAKQAALAAKATEAAHAAIENGNAKAADALIAAEASAPAPTEAPTKIAGFSTRKNFKAELAPGETGETALDKIICAIAGVDQLRGRLDLRALLELDTAAADRLARAQQGMFNVPGLVAVNRPVASSRAA